MKQLLVLIVTALSFITSAYAGGEVKEVCHDKKDISGKVIVDKDGKPIQVCKKIKVHKKLDGTPVPVKK